MVSMFIFLLASPIFAHLTLQYPCSARSRVSLSSLG